MGGHILTIYIQFRNLEGGYDTSSIFRYVGTKLSIVLHVYLFLYVGFGRVLLYSQLCEHKFHDEHILRILLRYS